MRPRWIRSRSGSRTSRATRTRPEQPAVQWDRWKNVLTEVAKISNWKAKVANSVAQTGNIVTGRGIALGGFAGTMAAVVADVSVNKKSGKITRVEPLRCRRTPA